MTNNKKEEQEKDILEVFRKVEVNISMLDAIKQIPRYAKFLKELCTNKRRLKGDEKVSVGENVSAVLKKNLPTKQKDPGMFTIPCTIGKSEISRCMLDLGASINVMPLSLYSSLNLGPLKPTQVILQLADKSITFPIGVIEDVLVNVNDLIFPADFYVLKMDENQSSSSTDSPILRGRPFMRTSRSRTKIDVYNGTLSMEFDGDKISFNVLDAMQHPSNESSNVSMIDAIDPHIEDTYVNALVIKDKPKVMQDKNSSKRSFNIGEKVLRHKTRLKLFSGKHLSKWIGPFVVTNTFKFDVVEIRSVDTGKIFKVDGHQLKLLNEGIEPREITSKDFKAPTYDKG